MMNLADPELELIDPTPNVHSMFLHFDKTFFWAKLSSRCVVRWSKRMYSCAGTCSYEGRGGLCDIALSEPLLKLRPRKDLVETLLHEMIHAYLFVTKRDQDRDGHGPNFQAHMHRINRAAGLNISIYHDFHDEVQLYQTHWWRCNGPCQLHRPHFGIVRRTNNRAPGPSDYWWNSHQKKCGGTFIKIKEPDKIEKKTKKTSVAKPSADITKYININNNGDPKEVSNKNVIQNDKHKKPILKDSSNVFVKPKVGVKNNNSNTLVITKKNVIFSPQVPKPVVFNGTGLTTCAKHLNDSDNKSTSSVNVLETVRNAWANKQISTNNLVVKNNLSTTISNPNKHKPDLHNESPTPKVKKIDDYFKTAATSVLKDLYGQDFNITQSKGNQKLKATPTTSNFVDCPVCNTNINSDDINRHLDECLNKSVIEKLSKEISPVVKNESFMNVRNVNNYPEDRSQLGEKASSIVRKSDNKNLNISSSVPNNDTIDLTNTGFVVDNNRKRPRSSFESGDLRTNKEIIDAIDNKTSKVRKSDSFLSSSTLNVVSNSLPQSTISISINPPHKIEQPGCSKSDSTLETACPCCGDTLNKSVDEHLDECLSFFENNTTIPEEGTSTSYINGTIVIDDEDDEFDESQTLNTTGTKLPCPCCLKMVEEIDMNSHLDKCLSQ